MGVEIKDVSHWFGSKKVLHNINLRINRGEIVALVGPSGCGKSTLLRAILGTHPPTEGAIRAGGTLVTRPQRDVGIVYQHYALFDFLTAQQNVEFGLMLDQTTIFDRIFNWAKFWRLRRQWSDEARVMLEKVSLIAAADKYPAEMSGGMRQRVAIAQALVLKPNILLLDEPFGALDEATRESLQVLLLTLYQENLEAKKKDQLPPHTILIVTHELNEAIYVSDRLLGLSQYHADNESGEIGATIVFDQPTPVFHPDDSRDFGSFTELKDKIRRNVFDPEVKQHHSDLIGLLHDKEATNG